MRILVVGHGGREHALLWKLRNDAPDADLFITRGNGGTGELASPLPIDPVDIGALAGWAEAHRADLTVVGPENPLADGIVDLFTRRGLPIFGPTKAATAIEASKAHAKMLMKRAGVPTAHFRTFTSFAEAEAYLRTVPIPVVVKASGLAGGKGAVVCETLDDAIDTAQQMLDEHAYGGAGNEIVIEEFMQGEEASILAITDGTNVVPLVPAQDHKRIGERDTGANTGGMGAYAPVSLVDDAVVSRVIDEVFNPTLAAMEKERAPFQGVLYAGLMLTDTGPKVVEFNARFGDPETQVLLPLMKSSLLELLLLVARGQSLKDVRAEWKQQHALTTVLAAAGYPGGVESGKAIDIPDDLDDDVLVFHAGTTVRDGQLVTSGGRVLTVTGLGSTLAEAAARSRDAAERIQFEGKQFRRDIGWRELQRHARAT